METDGIGMEISTELFMECIKNWAEFNPGALACAVELTQMFEIRALVVHYPITHCAGITGPNLYLLWNDCFDRDTRALGEFITANSHNTLRAIADIGDRYRAGEGRDFKAAVAELLASEFTGAAQEVTA